MFILNNIWVICIFYNTFNENLKKSDKSIIYDILSHDSFYADKINEERTARPQKQSSDIKTERN